MGSFYATCSITDLSITDGDPTYIQLLVPSWRSSSQYALDNEDSGCGEKGLRVSNDGALCEFSPFGFPIEGEYADYGDIDSIVRDKNVEMLEKFFNLKIEEIIACAQDDRWLKYGHPSSKDYKEDGVGDWSIGDNKMQNLEILKELTVTYFRKEHFDYLSQSFIGGDAYWINETKKRLESIKKDLTYLGKSKRGDSKDYKSLDSITDEDIKNYREIFYSQSNDLSDNQIKLIYWQMLNVSKDRLPSGLEYTFPIPSLCKFNMYVKLPINEDFIDEVIKQRTFVTNMHALYKVLRPSYYGSQTENFKAYVNFHRMSTELVAEIEEQNFKTRLEWELKNVLSDVLKDPELDLNQSTRDKLITKLRVVLKEEGIEI